MVEVIKNEEEIEKNWEVEGDGGEVDIDDEINEVEEYEVWKVWEIFCIKRDRDVCDKLLKEREEVEKLRNMIEEERREWERKNFKLLLFNKKKWKFM